ncbi:unnamed protein product, partial [marine sediment metagenome]
ITTFVPGIELKADSNLSTLMDESKKYVLSTGKYMQYYQGKIHDR